MSDAINHYLCANDLLEEGIVPFPIHRRMFLLGSQGPDIFFYHNVLEPRETKISLGDLLHKNRINDFFVNGLNTCMDAPPSYQLLIRSYYLGMVCHHALDVHTHPFIFYRSGLFLSDRPETKIYKHTHKKYEIQLDMAYYELRTGKKAYRFPVSTLFDAKSHEVEALEHFYLKTLKSTFDLTIGAGTVAKSLDKAKALTRLLSDPTGLKRLAIGFGEVLSGDPELFSSAFYGVQPMDPILVLNLDHQVWHHPCDLNQTFTSSYTDLFHEAHKDIRHKIQRISPMLSGEIPLNRKTLEEDFKDLGYDTGLPWESSPPIRFFDPILK